MFTFTFMDLSWIDVGLMLPPLTFEIIDLGKEMKNDKILDQNALLLFNFSIKVQSTS